LPANRRLTIEQLVRPTEVIRFGASFPVSIPGVSGAMKPALGSVCATAIAELPSMNRATIICVRIMIDYPS
jgi:hypothetical protein